jgi:hypothetical protein
MTATTLKTLSDAVVEKVPPLKEVRSRVSFIELQKVADFGDKTLRQIKKRLCLSNPPPSTLSFNGFRAYCVGNSQNSQGVVVVARDKLDENDDELNLYLIGHELTHIFLGHCSDQPISVPNSCVIRLQTILGSQFSHVWEYFDNIVIDYQVDSFLLNFIPELVCKYLQKDLLNIDMTINKLNNAANNLNELLNLTRIYCILKSRICLVNNCPKNSLLDDCTQRMDSLRTHILYNRVADRIACQTVEQTRDLLIELQSILS